MDRGHIPFLYHNVDGLASCKVKQLLPCIPCVQSGTGSQFTANHHAFTQVVLVEALQVLAAALDGELLMSDPSSTPPVWNALLHTASPIMKAPSPLCRVLCGSRGDVAKCARFAVEHKLPIVARGELKVWVAVSMPCSQMIVDDMGNAWQGLRMGGSQHALTLKPQWSSVA